MKPEPAFRSSIACLLLTAAVLNTAPAMARLPRPHADAGLESGALAERGATGPALQYRARPYGQGFENRPVPPCEQPPRRAEARPARLAPATTPTGN